MSGRIDLFENVGNAVSCLSSVLGCLLRFIWLMILPKAVLVTKVMAAENQVAACVDAIDRKKAPKPRFKLSFRLLWVALSRLLSEWRKLAHVMRPDAEARASRPRHTAEPVPS